LAAHTSPFHPSNFAPASLAPPYFPFFVGLGLNFNPQIAFGTSFIRKMLYDIASKHHMFKYLATNVKGENDYG
jgi:hypothetical protein